MSFTFCMIKPDSMSRKQDSAILDLLEKEGFVLVKKKRLHLSPAFCEIFYAEHSQKEFFPSLTAFISSGEVLALLLKKEGAVFHLRKVMGATDPAKAEPQTLRARFGSSVEQNAVHGSDSEKSARREIALFFPEHR